MNVSAMGGKVYRSHPGSRWNDCNEKIGSAEEEKTVVVVERGKSYQLGRLYLQWENVGPFTLPEGRRGSFVPPDY